jgi:hypothetical protein
LKLKNSVLYKSPTPIDLRLGDRVKPRLNRARFGLLPVALNFFGKTLAIAKIVCYKRSNFGKSPALVAFFTKDSSVCPFKH